MQRWLGRVAVVTGASSGIGAATAYLLQDAGVTVVAVARRSDQIPDAVKQARAAAAARGRSPPHKASAPGTLHARPCDVSKEEDVRALFKWIKENVGRVDILVNNAGLGAKTSPAGMDSAEWKRLLDVNVLGLSVCTREAIQMMREKGIDDGHIVHIGSIAGHVLPFTGDRSIYFSTKHAVRVLTEGLRKELVAAKSKIRVTEVSPGLTETEFFKNVKAKPSGPAVFSEDVADTILFALAAPPHVQIHEIIVIPTGQQF